MGGRNLKGWGQRWPSLWPEAQLPKATGQTGRPPNSPGARKGESPSDFLRRLLRMVADLKFSQPQVLRQCRKLRLSRVQTGSP